MSLTLNTQVQIQLSKRPGPSTEADYDNLKVDFKTELTKQ